ncbi:nucleotidyltransferase domain-containing protein [Caldifermentibacillus hisashii]|uniref:nucleotidyltransferase domain-containing protein n=1 Tax=Caldifermentibacillus hisashii TaxID=996558 RepID=UPI003D1571EA
MIELKPISKSISEDEILKCVSYTSNDFVFVSGSLIEGLGNKKSDLDIFVITQLSHTVIFKHCLI